MIDVYLNDDYCGLEVDKEFNFYFGYEMTYCSKCKKHNCGNDAHEDFREWCFVAERNGEMKFIPKSKLEKHMKDYQKNRELAYYLLTGIALIMKEMKKNGSSRRKTK